MNNHLNLFGRAKGIFSAAGHFPEGWHILLKIDVLFFWEGRWAMILKAQQREQLLTMSRARTWIERVVDLGQRICAVAAPTGEERERAEFVASLLRERGYTPEIDEVGNVYTRRGKRGKGPLLMILTHIDT